MAAKKPNKNAPHLKEAAATQRMSQEDLAKLLEKAADEGDDADDDAEGDDAEGDDAKAADDDGAAPKE